MYYNWQTRSARVSARKKQFGYRVDPPKNVYFLGAYDLKMLKYAPQYRWIPSQVMEIVIFNKGLFKNLGTYH
jgi:hypothetical protein